MLLFHCLQGFVTKQVNSNKYYITTSCIPCNTYSYSYVITITAYQMYHKLYMTRKAISLQQDFCICGVVLHELFGFFCNKLCNTSTPVANFQFLILTKKQNYKTYKTLLKKKKKNEGWPRIKIHTLNFKKKIIIIIRRGTEKFENS